MVLSLMSGNHIPFLGTPYHLLNTKTPDFLSGELIALRGPLGGSLQNAQLESTRLYEQLPCLSLSPQVFLLCFFSIYIYRKDNRLKAGNQLVSIELLCSDSEA